MGTMTSKSDGGDESWYINSGALNHMTCHGEWFEKMQPMETQDYVVTGDDTQHPITHVRGTICFYMYLLSQRTYNQWVKW